MRILTLLLLALCLAGSPRVPDAQVSIIGKISRLGKIAKAIPDTTTTILKGRVGSGAVGVAADGRMVLSKATGAGLATYTFQNVDELMTAVSRIPSEILIPEELLALNADLARKIVTTQPDNVRLVPSSGQPVPLKLRMLTNAANQLVVEPSAGLTLTIEAWKRRGVLQAPIMADLLARTRIVALVPHTDQVQRAFLTERLGDRVAFAESEKALTIELAAASRRVVVVLGHVEDGRYVLRDARGATLVDRPVEAVHDLVDQGRSVALLMGCRVACGVARSGPLVDIDALETISALSTTEGITTPLAFLQHVARSIGPLHVELDLLGRMRGVSSTNIGSPSMPGVAVTPFQLAAAARPKAPVTAASIALTVQEGMMILLAGGLAGWLIILMAFWGPRRGWAAITEHYVSLSRRPEIDMVPLGQYETVLLLVLGPWAFFTLIISGLFALLLWLTLPAAISFGLPINWLRIQDEEQLTVGAEPWLAGWLPRWVNAAVPACALALIFMVVGIGLLEMVAPAIYEAFPGPYQWILIISFLTAGLALQYFVPAIKQAFTWLLLFFSLPSLAAFGTIRLLAGIPGLIGGSREGV